MKKAAKVAISVVAVVAFIGVFVGIGSNQVNEKTDYQRIIEDTMSSNQQAGEQGKQTEYQKTLEESVSSKSTSPSEPSAPVQPTPTKENSCDPSYPDFCIPPPPPDLNCSDIPQKKFRVLQPDPHGFDGDKDGIGCES